MQRMTRFIGAAAQRGKSFDIAEDCVYTFSW
jgi:hypothetical protein